LAAQYYAATGDREFFTRDPEIYARLKWLIDGAMRLRVGKTWLLDSKLISDGPAAGDYHTGSNVFAWYCLTGFARIAEEVMKDSKSAASCRKAADGIKNDLLKHNVIDGPFGKQYVEGVNTDGKLPMHKPSIGGIEGAKDIPYLAHDGEESDTTLASFYGFTSYDDPALHNYKRFSLSEHNVIYLKEFGGILWEHSTTFPGYVSGLAATRDAATMSGPEGYLTRIRRLTDLDGSIWWWPYHNFSTSCRDVDHPVRGVGKCGWGSGVFSCLFISQFLGLSYDAPTKTLDFRPFSPSSDFEWKRFRLGTSVFSASFKRECSKATLRVTNHNDSAVTVRFRAILPDGNRASKVILDGKPYKGKTTTERFFDSAVIVLSSVLKPAQCSIVEVEVST